MSVAATKTAATNINRWVDLGGDNKFWRAFLVAALVECAFVAGFIKISESVGHKSATNAPMVVKLTIQQPPPPPVPKPQPPPPPPPPVPVPVQPPPPPPPQPAPRPVVRKLLPHKLPPLAAPVLQTPPPPPPPVATPPDAQLQASAEQLYAAALNARVQSSLVVPDQVRLMGLSGHTQIAVTVAPNGAVLAVRVLQSSGIPPIDEAATAAVRAVPLPPFSGKMPQSAVTFTLTVRLSTQNN